MTNFLNTTSEQLTEQWRKGELPDDEYYCRTTHNSSVCKHYLSNIDNENMIEILAQVPSYEEWQAKLEENKRLKHDVGNLGYKIKNQRHEIDNRLKEIKNLKELLKECKQWFDWYHIDTGIGKEYIESWHKKGYEIHKQIDEVLK